MRAWLEHLTRGHILELALAVALGSASAAAAERLAEAAMNVLAQHAGRDPSGEGGDVTILGLIDLFSAPYYLNFEIGGTVVVYGQVLAAVLSLGLVALGALVIVRRRDRELGACPFCASRIPYESTHCAYCGSGVGPGES